MCEKCTCSHEEDIIQMKKLMEENKKLQDENKRLRRENNRLKYANEMYCKFIGGEQ